MHGKRSRLLGLVTCLLLASALTLAACNSSSGSSQRTSSNTVTGAESPMPAKALAKGTIFEALSNQLKGSQ